MNLFGGVIPVTGISFLMLCVFAIAAVGYALGRITIKGVALGDAAVFIIALVFGAFFFKPLEAQLMVDGAAYAEKALEIIRLEYAEPLSIDAVSRTCGYSKSNFCTIFKSITGETFHGVLNRHRVDVACLHLESTNLTIEEVSERVGFADAKSFCRVFKKTKGMTAGEYRKKHRAS